MVIVLWLCFMIIRIVLILNPIVKRAVSIKVVPIVFFHLLIIVVVLMRYFREVGASITPDFCDSDKKI